MNGVEASRQELEPTVTFSNSNDFGAIHQQQQEHQDESTSVDAEWDPAQFDLSKSSNPSWSGKETGKEPPKPKRIQDIRLQRLDSEERLSSNGQRTPEQELSEDGSVFDSWPYEEGSPCALFGKVKMTSSPAKGFEKTGEFSSGDPEWENGSKGSRRSGRSSESREKSRRRRRQQQQQEEENENDEGSCSSGSDFGSQSGGSEQYSESERSLTESPIYDDEDVMVTPAMGKAKEQRKKPPTLKRGAHGVATPSVVKALKGKQAFTSDDEGDNGNIDFDEFDSDVDSAGSGHSRKSRDNGARSKREGRFDAASNSFRRASLQRKSSKKFSFDRSMSSADLKAARKANNSFKGQMEMNKSFSALESKRRAQRKQKDMHGSFSGSSNKKSSRSPQQTESRCASRKVPTRAKSMGNPTGEGSKLKSALSKFAGATEETATKPKPSGKNYGATLSALKFLSGSDAGDKAGDKESDLKSAIMQQVYRSSSGLNPLELKRKPKPKIEKSLSLSASGMARAAAANGEILEAKEAPQRVRRSKTSMERAQASLSDFNHSYHESMAKMRKHKMADASERSAQSAISAQSAASQSSKESSSSNQRPSNLDRKAKSFSHASRAGASLGKDEDEEPASPEQKPSIPRLKRGSSKRLQSPGSTSSGSDLEGKGGSGHASRRGLQKSGSRRRIKPEYDANTQTPNGTSVVALLKTQETVTDTEMMQKGNRQIFHALMFKTRMGIDMDKLRQKVEGGGDDDEDDDDKDARADESEGSDEE